MSTFLVTAAQYAVDAPRDWADAESRLRQTVAAMTRDGARLIVFPEYTSMVLTALSTADVRRDMARQLAELQTLRDAWLQLHIDLARRHGAYILAGTFPWRLADDRYVNRAWLCSPAGAAEFQDKLIMTRFEREEWNIHGTQEVKVFDTALGRIGIAICYDIEFPLMARAQAQAGAILLLAPSCTDTLAGYWRVRTGAQARALENQCCVVQASLVGEAPSLPAIDINTGAAAIYGPPDRGFPDNGLLACGTLGEPGWVSAEIDPRRIAAVRNAGEVLNHRHWQEQPGAAGLALPVTVCSL
jgi:predicted amidohydrolase